jgi:hypothetical protein
MKFHKLFRACTVLGLANLGVLASCEVDVQTTEEIRSPLAANVPSSGRGAVATPDTGQNAEFYSGLSPHKLGVRHRNRAGRNSTLFAGAPALPNVEATIRSRSGAWAAAGAATFELKGTWSPNATFAWAANAEIVGSGARVNVIAPLAAGAVQVQSCVTDPPNGPLCVNTAHVIAPAAMVVKLDPVTTIGTWSGGRWIRIAGQVQNIAAAAPVVRLFVHTDVFYGVACATVDSNGRFSTIIHTANNVDRVVAMAMAPTYNWSSGPGCNSNFCFGRRDLLTGRYLPLPVDETNVQAFAVYYAKRESIVTALDELKQRSMATSVPGAMQPARLVRSELDGEVCFLYDQALAAIAFVDAGDRLAAEQILNALVNVQRSDGSWYFAYRGNGTSDFPSAGDVRYAGAVAWVALALNAYAQAYGIGRYAASHAQLMSYISSQMITVDGARAMRFNPADINSTPWDERSQTALEHAIDAYAAMDGYQRLLSNAQYAFELDGIATYIAHRWNGADFSPGFMLNQGANTTELYLDTQAWTPLALGALGAAYAAGLQTNCAQLFEPAGTLGGGAGIRGFYHFRWRTGPGAMSPFVWSEGTAGMALAMQRFAPTMSCNGRTASDLLADLDSIAVPGGLPASTDNTLSDFSESPATASLAWYLFARSGLNPFRPWEARTPVL